MTTTPEHDKKEVNLTMDDRKLSLFAGMIKIVLPKVECTGKTEDMLRAAMQAAKVHWHIAAESEDIQFRAAVGAVLLWLHDLGDTEMSERIKVELGVLNALAAASAGIPVDFGAVCDDRKELKPFGLLAMWKEEPVDVPNNPTQGQ